MKLTQKLGDSFTWPIPLVRLDGSPIDPSGCSVIFTAKLKPNTQGDADSVFQKSLDFGITLSGDSASGYTAHIAVLPLDTRSLAPGTLFCEVQVQSIADPDRVASTPTHTLALVRDVTRETVTSVDVHTEQAPAPVLEFGFTPLVTAAPLGGGRFLAIDESGAPVYADAALGRAAVGFISEAVDAGATAKLRRAGTLGGLSGLMPGATYFLGENGLITATAPAAGLIQSLGVASAPDTLLVDIERETEVAA